MQVQTASLSASSRQRPSTRVHQRPSHLSRQAWKCGDQLAAEWLVRGEAAAPTRVLSIDPTPITIAEVSLAHWKHADAYYRDERGEPTGHHHQIRHALRRLNSLYDATPAAEFGPLALAALQDTAGFRANTEEALARFVEHVTAAGPCTAPVPASPQRRVRDAEAVADAAAIVFDATSAS